MSSSNKILCTPRGYLLAFRRHEFISFIASKIVLDTRHFDLFTLIEFNGILLRKKSETQVQVRPYLSYL